MNIWQARKYNFLLVNFGSMYYFLVFHYTVAHYFTIRGVFASINDLQAFKMCQFKPHNVIF